MRKWLALLAGVLMLAAANYAIYSKEQLLAQGRIVLLELAPVDPRSLMQGDYMALRFKVAAEAIEGDKIATTPPDGGVVLRLDAQGVGRFVRLDDGAPLAPDEVRMRYRIRAGSVRFATNAFFFQEGDADLYSGAGYGEFRVEDDGDSILTGLRGKEMEPLGLVSGP